MVRHAHSLGEFMMVFGLFSTKVESMTLKQNLPPGCHRLFYCGDVLFLRLEASEAEGDSTGFVRTNLGRGAVRRREVVNRVETGAPLAHADWHDVPMTESETGVFEARIPLSEPGFFQAKAFVLTPGQTEPKWVEGDNVYLHVQPAGFAAQNSLYNAFVRQFGPSRSKPLDGNRERSARALEEAGYAAIPPSGTFRDLIPHLDTIMNAMGFRILQLLPIFPAPTVYARMGRFGSPFAPTDFFSPDPALAEFDRQSTPLDQFRELTDAVHARGGQVILDIPLNHTGWGSALQSHHPEWFKRNPDGTFQSPGAWDVVWEDLTELEYTHRELWRTIADLLLFWCGQGVDGFRCDAGYMIPQPVWEYLTAKVRLQYPETLFFLEGLGGKLSTTEALLGPGGMNWAYSELFQTEDRKAMDRYLPYANTVSEQRGLLLHFAETHDNNRLAANGRTHARMRTVLAALCAPNGAFGITNGVEWFAREKVDVHGASCLNWGATPNLVEELRRLNALLACHPCFHPGATLQLVHHKKTGNAIALLRTNGDRRLLVLVNLDAAAKQTVVWPAEVFPPASNSALDILGEGQRDIKANGHLHQLTLEPGQALCLTTEAEDSARLEHQLEAPLAHCGRVMRQRAHALAAAVHERLHPGQSITEGAVESLAQSLMNSPKTALRAAAADLSWAGVAVWRAGTDETRQVMIPPNHFLLVVASAPFRVRIFHEQAVLCHEHSLAAEPEDTHFAILMPPAPTDTFAECQLQLHCYEQNEVQRSDGPILLLPPPERSAVRLSAPRALVLENDLYAVCANRHGAVAHVNGEWGRLDSVYDCLLGANLNPNVPVDRHIMLRRLRAWAVVRGYSTELKADSLDSFGQKPDGTVVWQFRFPAADGLYVTMRVRLRLCELRNRNELRFSRPAAEDEQDLPDSAPVRLVLRPDLEDRICHGVTKASEGPGQTWPDAISDENGGFTFQPSPERTLHVSLTDGGFVREPEWLYAVPHPVEASRDLEHLSDLFSPGYLHAELHGDEHTDFSADHEAHQRADTNSHAADGAADNTAPPSPAPDASTTLRILEQSMDRFVVRRGKHRTVIAGYPWFLDWGRDTLICLRGLIAAGRLEESRDILIQFARFEQNGTIPNMIRGDDASNRDTSDAPLWLFTALNDLLEAEGGDTFLDADAGGRPIRDILGAIGKNLLAGTPNGIAVDPKTGLVFSPPHFTWMDTNHPAGTPREGYPVEIQALWHAALDLLIRIDDANTDWRELRNQVRETLPRLFFRPELGYFSDCLHASPGMSAAEAQADDHLRPNQLFALTLGAVRDRDMAQAALNACEELLVPGAIRSLANRAVQHQLLIRGPAGLLNNPTHPYWGRYEGDEDTRRKPAYHNGTAWTWPFPSYCEALAKWQGESAQFTARCLLQSSVHLLNRGCIAQLPEIIDGDAPHTFRGCGAQAWSVTELYRVLKLLTQQPQNS